MQLTSTNIAHRLHVQPRKCTWAALCCHRAKPCCAPWTDPVTSAHMQRIGFAVWLNGAMAHRLCCSVHARCNHPPPRRYLLNTQSHIAASRQARASSTCPSGSTVYDYMFYSSPTGCHRQGRCAPLLHGPVPGRPPVPPLQPGVRVGLDTLEGRWDMAACPS